MNNYEALLAEKQKLSEKLSDINKELEDMKKVIVRGKVEKAIALLNECASHISNYLIIDCDSYCEDCGAKVSLELDVYDIISALKNTVDSDM